MSPSRTATARDQPHPHLPPPMGMGELSVWQRSTRDHSLLNAGEHEALPERADVVIVGSGMCGAVIAHSLLTAPDRPKTIVVLEAREICSGASGRNAGHCRPDAARGFTAFAGHHGAEQAKHVLSSETEVLGRVDAFINKHQISCEWTPRPTIDVCLSDEFRAYESAALQGLRAAGGEPEGFNVLDAAQSRETSRISHPDNKGAFTWSAATLNPAQITLGIHELNVAEGGFHLFSHAPVHAVVPAAAGTGDEAWLVRTPRGDVTTPKVIFATNAYSQALVPELEGLIVPCRAQAIKLPAPPAVQGEGVGVFPPLEPSYSLRNTLTNFYSVPDHSIVLGTSRHFPNMTPETAAALVNTVDDAAPLEAVTKDGMRAWTRLFPEWVAARGGEGNAEYAWAGIIGMTPDSVPFIGDVPGKKGQYIAAGYNGHGMARIFLCAPALAQYVLRGTWDEAMPSCFRTSPERLARLREKVAEAALAAAAPTGAGAEKDVGQGEGTADVGAGAGESKQEIAAAREMGKVREADARGEDARAEQVSLLGDGVRGISIRA